MDYTSMSLVEIAKLDGVKDLRPMLTKARFAQALKAEAEGRPADAARLLDEAVAAEG